MIRFPTGTKRFMKGTEYTFNMLDWSYLIVPQKVKVSVNRGAFKEVPSPFECNKEYSYSFSSDCVCEVGFKQGSNDEMSIMPFGTKTISKGDLWRPVVGRFNAIRIPLDVSVSVNGSDFIFPKGDIIKVGEFDYVFSKDVIVTKYNITSKVSNKNYLINGGFMIWQRGTVFTSSGYTADRWFVPNNNTGANVSRVAGGLGTDYKSHAIELGGKSDVPDNINIQQRVEDIRALQGVKVTFSAKIWSADAGKDIKVEFRQVDTDGYSVVWSSGLLHLGTTNSLTQTMFITVDVPPWITPDPQGNAHFRVLIFYGTNMKDKSVTIGEAKLEVGDRATPFELPNFGEELMKCQRYYQIRSKGTINELDLSPTMRTAPTKTDLSGKWSYSAEY